MCAVVAIEETVMFVVHAVIVADPVPRVHCTRVDQRHKQEHGDL